MKEQRLKEIENEIENWNDMNWDVSLVYELIKEIRQHNRIFKGIAYSTFKGDSFEKMAREYAKEVLEK